MDNIVLFIAHQRQKLTIIVSIKNVDFKTSCCYAMVTDVLTKRYSGLYLLYLPCYFPSASARLSIRAPPDSLRQYLAKERRATEIFWDRYCGESICGLEELQKDHTFKFSWLRATTKIF